MEDLYSFPGSMQISPGLIRGIQRGSPELWGLNVPHPQGTAGLQFLTASSCLFIE